jgi:hypothetical protein
MADLTSAPKGYRDLPALVTTNIRTAQLRASIAVNQELVILGLAEEVASRQDDRIINAELHCESSTDGTEAFERREGSGCAARAGRRPT